MTVNITIREQEILDGYVRAGVPIESARRYAREEATSEQVIREDAECVLPGCRERVDDVGQACADCIAAFGSYLVAVDREPMTTAAIAERDAGTRELYVRMLTPTDDPPAPTRRQNQTCWLCEQRRACTLVDDRWECDACAATDGELR